MNYLDHNLIRSSLPYLDGRYPIYICEICTLKCWSLNDVQIYYHKDGCWKYLHENITCEEYIIKEILE